MVQNTNKAATAAPTAPVEIVVPAAFKNTSLKGASLTLAINTGVKHPEIVQAVTELAGAMQAAGEKYYHVLHTLRAAKLQKKEATALLLGLGLTKGRASELNKLSSAKEEVWKKYSEKTVGFRAALALENGKSSPVGTPGKKRVVAKIHSVPKDIQTMIAESVKGWVKPNKDGKRTEYGFTVEQDGITLYFQIFADKKD